MNVLALAILSIPLGAILLGVAFHAAQAAAWLWSQRRA